MISTSKVVDKLTEVLRPIGKGLLQTIKRSPDADIFLALHIAGYFAPRELLPESLTGRISLMTLFGLAAIKQYIWGWGSYNFIKDKIRERNGDISASALRENYLTWRAPCIYFGSKYAIREFEKQQTEKRKSLAGATV